MVGTVGFLVTVLIAIALRRWPSRRAMRILGLGWPIAIVASGVAMAIYSAAIPAGTAEHGADLAGVGILAGGIIAAVGLASGLMNFAYLDRYDRRTSNTS